MIFPMAPEDWASLKHFKRDENWGEPDRMSRALLAELDRWRAFLGRPVLITAGTQGGHKDKSQHWLGNAVDLVIPHAQPRDLMDLFIAAMRFNFTGIGLYPYWKCNGQRTGGLHLDQRELKPGEYRAMWMAVPVTTPEGKVVQQYLPLTRENLTKHGVLGVLA